MKQLAKKVLAWLSSPIEEVEAELIPGVTKPTTTLARMIVLELLKDDFLPDGTSYTHPKFRIRWTEGKEIGKVVPTARECEEARIHNGSGIFWKKEYADPSNSYYSRSVEYAIRKRSARLPAVATSVDVTCQDCVFDKTEKDIIKEGLNKALGLYKERQKNKSHYDNQQKAVDAIADWMGHNKEKEKECPSTIEKPKSTRKKPDVGAFLTAAIE